MSQKTSEERSFTRMKKEEKTLNVDEEIASIKQSITVLKTSVKAIETRIDKPTNVDALVELLTSQGVDKEKIEEVTKLINPPTSTETEKKLTCLQTQITDKDEKIRILAEAVRLNEPFELIDKAHVINAIARFNNIVPNETPEARAKICFFARKHGAESTDIGSFCVSLTAPLETAETWLTTKREQEGLSKELIETRLQELKDARAKLEIELYETSTCDNDTLEEIWTQLEANWAEVYVLEEALKGFCNVGDRGSTRRLTKQHGLVGKKDEETEEPSEELKAHWKDQERKSKEFDQHPLQVT